MQRTKNSMPMIKKILFLCMCSISTLYSQVPINGNMFAQNAWFYVKNPVQPNLSDMAPELINAMPDVLASGVRYMRIGGIDANFYPLFDFNTSTQAINNANRLVYLINAIRAESIEPIVTVGYNPVCSSLTGDGSFGTQTHSEQVTLAANLVEYLNDPLSSGYLGSGNEIEYWIISNEPDHDLNCSEPKGFGWQASSYASSISTYLKDFSAAMKAKDPDIKIIGPELSRFGNDHGYNSGAGEYYNPSNEIMNQLISDPTMNANSVMGKIGTNNYYYVDVVSFHYYPQNITGASSVISDPTLVNDGFRYRLNPTSGKLSLLDMIANTGRTVDDLKIACTEFNIELQGSYVGPDEDTDFANMVNGYDSRSYVGGQWLAEMFAEAMATYDVNSAGKNECWVQFMAPWSVTEGGCDQDSTESSVGYISNCSGHEGDKRSQYHHYKLLADYLDGDFFREQQQSLL
jgi:hypothetical protein